MRQASIRRLLMVWVLGALSLGALILIIAAYGLSLHEIDEVLDDSLRQTALLLADRDLAAAFPTEPIAAALASADTESKLVAIARHPDGSLLFTSEPGLSLRFEATPGPTVQRANDAQWHVFTVVQADRIVQVAQPISVRHEGAVEAASQLLLPMLLLIAMIGIMLVAALRRGLQPLHATSVALAQRSASSLTALDAHAVPLELVPLVQTLNDLLQRLAGAFEHQRHFVADAAHELRSPVTALQLQVQVLERSRDAAEQREAAAELSAGITRVRRLIEQLLYLSRAAADDSAGALFARERVNLGELARSVVARWSDEAERRQIDLGADVGPDAWIEGDAAQLEVLLNNLVDNALRYTRSGGIVDVAAGRIAGAPVLSVIDNGPGIAPAERSRVFDRFYRSPDALARAQAGSGLGLAIVKAIADRHGAAVSLDAGRDGVGLQVRVVFTAPA